MSNVERKWPLFIMSGEKYNGPALKIAAQWHEYDLGSEFHILENAGHCANMDNPDVFNEILMKFIKTI